MYFPCITLRVGVHNTVSVSIRILYHFFAVTRFHSVTLSHDVRNVSKLDGKLISSTDDVSLVDLRADEIAVWTN
jgi:hypothetical protein